MYLFKSFRAKIRNCIIKSSLINPAPIDLNIKFTKKGLLLKDSQKGRIFLPGLTCLEDCAYKFFLDTDLYGKKRYYIHIGRDKYELAISPSNRVKANILHNQYWIQKKGDEIMKIIIGSIVSALVYLLFHGI